jgi:6-phosphogluconolactonase
LDRKNRFAFVPHTRPNAIFQFYFDDSTGKLSANDAPKLLRKADSGPRHLWFHPDNRFAYGSDEQGSSLTVYQFDQETGQLKTIQTLSSLPAHGFEGRNSTSDIEVHPSGQFVYIANRGHDTIASYAIDPASGRLSLLDHTPTESVTRSFNISPDGRYLIAAGQKSGKLAVFQVGDRGSLTRIDTVSAGKNPWWVQIVQR